MTSRPRPVRTMGLRSSAGILAAKSPTNVARWAMNTKAAASSRISRAIVVGRRAQAARSRSTGVRTAFDGRRDEVVLNSTFLLTDVWRRASLRRLTSSSPRNFPGGGGWFRRFCLSRAGARRVSTGVLILPARWVVVRYDARARGQKGFEVLGENERLVADLGGDQIAITNPLVNEGRAADPHQFQIFDAVGALAGEQLSPLLHRCGAWRGWKLCLGHVI